MESARLAAILSDLYVTFEAERRLGVGIERLMALSAVTLELGVVANHPSRHDQRLKVDRACARVSEGKVGDEKSD